MVELRLRSKALVSRGGGWSLERRSSASWGWTVVGRGAAAAFGAAEGGDELVVPRWGGTAAVAAGVRARGCWAEQRAAGGVRP